MLVPSSTVWEEAEEEHTWAMQIGKREVAGRQRLQWWVWGHCPTLEDFQQEEFSGRTLCRDCEPARLLLLPYQGSGST